MLPPRRRGRPDRVGPRQTEEGEPRRKAQKEPKGLVIKNLVIKGLLKHHRTVASALRRELWRVLSREEAQSSASGKGPSARSLETAVGDTSTEAAGPVRKL